MFQGSSNGGAGKQFVNIILPMLKILGYDLVASIVKAYNGSYCVSVQFRGTPPMLGNTNSYLGKGPIQRDLELYV